MLDMYDMGGTLVLDYWAIVQVVASANPNSLKIMISGAPASGKGTQCELITKKVSFFIIWELLPFPIAISLIITDVNNAYDDRIDDMFLTFKSQF